MVDWFTPLLIALTVMVGLWALLFVLPVPSRAGMLNHTQSTT